GRAVDRPVGVRRLPERRDADVDRRRVTGMERGKRKSREEDVHSPSLCPEMSLTYETPARDRLTLLKRGQSPFMEPSRAEERFSVDDCAAGEPRPRREATHLDVHCIGIVFRMLRAVLAQPVPRVVLARRLPAGAAVHEELELSHLRRRTRRASLPSASP